MNSGRPRTYVVRCPVCWEHVEICAGHEERDMQMHLLEHRWNPKAIIEDAIYGK